MSMGECVATGQSLTLGANPLRFASCQGGGPKFSIKLPFRGKADTLLKTMLSYALSSNLRHGNIIRYCNATSQRRGCVCRILAFMRVFYASGFRVISLSPTLRSRQDYSQQWHYLRLY